MGEHRFGISYQVLNSISHEWDIELSTWREILYLQTISAHNHILFSFLCKHTNHDCFQRFLTAFRRFPKILQKFFKGQNVFEHFPKISSNYRRFSKIVPMFSQGIMNVFKHFPKFRKITKISENSSKVFWRHHERFRTFSENSVKLPKIFEHFRRLQCSLARILRVVNFPVKYPYLFNRKVSDMLSASTECCRGGNSPQCPVNDDDV